MIAASSSVAVAASDPFCCLRCHHRHYTVAVPEYSELPTGQVVDLVWCDSCGQSSVRKRDRAEPAEQALDVREAPAPPTAASAAAPSAAPAKPRKPAHDVGRTRRRN